MDKIKYPNYAQQRVISRAITRKWSPLSGVLQPIAIVHGFLNIKNIFGKNDGDYRTRNIAVEGVIQLYPDSGVPLEPITILGGSATSYMPTSEKVRFRVSYRSNNRVCAQVDQVAGDEGYYQMIVQIEDHVVLADNSEFSEADTGFTIAADTMHAMFIITQVVLGDEPSTAGDYLW